MLPVTDIYTFLSIDFNGVSEKCVFSGHPQTHKGANPAPDYIKLGHCPHKTPVDWNFSQRLKPGRDLCWSTHISIPLEAVSFSRFIFHQKFILRWGGGAEHGTQRLNNTDYVYTSKLNRDRIWAQALSHNHLQCLNISKLYWQLTSSQTMLKHIWRLGQASECSQQPSCTVFCKGKMSVMWHEPSPFWLIIQLSPWKPTIFKEVWPF